MEKKALQLASVASMIDQFNLPNIKLLRSLDYHVDVVADFTNLGNISRERAVELIKYLESKDVRVIDIAVPRTLNPKAVFSAYKRVKELLVSEHYDLIHCHSPIGGVITRIAAKSERRIGTYVIYTAHGFHFYDGAPFKNWIIFYPIEKWLSRYTDLLITINKEDYKRAKTEFKAKKVIYTPGIGVDTKLFMQKDPHCRKQKRQDLGLTENDILLLSVGELNDNKNHATVVKALGAMKNKGILPDNLYYIIVGKGNKREELKGLITRCGLEGKVKLAGFRRDVVDYYNAADVFMFPSFREGLSVSLMEAMASALPIICSHIRGNTDLLEENMGGFFFDPKHVDTVISAIRKVMDANLK